MIRERKITIYKYIANSEHKGHLVQVLKWGKGKVKIFCCDCDIIFIGIKRCLRKIDKGEER